MVNNNISAQSRMTFPWLQDRIDTQGLDGWWLPCMHHLFRDILRYHGIPSPLHVLVRPLHLVFFVDKNGYPWLWDGPEEEFLHPTFNQGVRGKWRTETQIEDACHRIWECLEEGRIPLIYMEWFYAPFTTQYKKMRGNLHAVAVIDYNQDDETLYIIDRTALPASRGGFAKDRGWVPVAHLHTAIREDFGWFDYHLEQPTLPWATELQTLLFKSVSIMRDGRFLTTPSSTHGIQAIREFAYFLQSLSETDITTRRFSSIFHWHLPPCIRKFIIGQRCILNLMLSQLDITHCEPVSQVQIAIQETNQLWEQVAAALFRMGFEQRIQYRSAIEELLAQLIEKEGELIDALEKVAHALSLSPIDNPYIV